MEEFNIDDVEAAPENIKFLEELLSVYERKLYAIRSQQYELAAKSRDDEKTLLKRFNIRRKPDTLESNIRTLKLKLLLNE